MNKFQGKFQQKFAGLKRRSSPSLGVGFGFAAVGMILLQAPWSAVLVAVGMAGLLTWAGRR